MRADPFRSLFEHVDSSVSASARRATFLTSILDGNRPAAERCARDVLERCGLRFLYEEIVAGALHSVGELWLANRISIADEHLATATAQSAVAALYPRFPWLTGGPRALVACVAGERHDFGARMVADLLALDGWDERFLGSDVPTADLAEKARGTKAKLVALSMTLAVHVPIAVTAIAAVRAALPEAKILVGGRATRSILVAASIGADAVAGTVSEAVEVARAWK